AEFMHPHARDPGEARALDLVPDHAGFHHAFAEGEIRRWAHGRGDAEDWIVAVIDALHFDQRLLARTRGVISGELAERPLPRLDVLDHLPFEHDLRMGRHRQAIKLTEHDLIRVAAMATGIVVFAQAKFKLVAASKEQQRIVSARDQHGTRFAGAEIFLSDLAAVLAWRDPQR